MLTAQGKLLNNNKLYSTTLPLVELSLFDFFPAITSSGKSILKRQRFYWRIYCVTTSTLLTIYNKTNDTILTYFFQTMRLFDVRLNNSSALLQLRSKRLVNLSFGALQSQSYMSEAINGKVKLNRIVCNGIRWQVLSSVSVISNVPPFTSCHFPRLLATPRFAKISCLAKSVPSLKCSNASFQPYLKMLQLVIA